MNIKTAPIFQTLLLASVLFLLQSVDWAGFSLSETLQTAPISIALAALVNAAAVVWLIRQIPQTGWRLAGAMWLAFYGVTTFLVAVEAVYLSDVLSMEVARQIFINGAITSALFCTVVVGVLKGWNAAQPNPVGRPIHLTASVRAGLGLAGRLVLAGGLWTVVFVLVGLLVFQPLARALDPVAAEAYLAAFDASAGGFVLLFQTVRGMLWALLTLPLVRMLPDGRARTGLALSVCFAVWMGANLLYPSGLPQAIQTAHFVEVTVENFVYGWVVAVLFADRRAPGPVLTQSSITLSA